MRGSPIRRSQHLDGATAQYAGFSRAAVCLSCLPKLRMIDTIMDTSNSITAAIFSAFLKCPTKAYLLAIGEPIPNSFFTDIEPRISSSYNSELTATLPVAAQLHQPLD